MSLSILDIPPPPADFRLRYGRGRQHFGDLRLPAGTGPHPVVIGVHGGFWRARYDLGYYGHLCAALAACGVATWNIEYRRVGQWGGGWPGTLEHVARAADHLRTLAASYALDLNRVVTLGHSAGGHLALWLAGRPRIPTDSLLHTATPLPLRGAISLAGVCDLRQGWELNLGSGAVGAFMGGSPERLPKRYASASPAALLPLGVQQALIHGSDDDNVPLVLSENYHAAASALGDDVTLHILPATAHFEPVDPQSHAWPTVRDVVLEMLEIRLNAKD